MLYADEYTQVSSSGQSLQRALRALVGETSCFGPILIVS